VEDRVAVVVGAAGQAGHAARARGQALARAAHAGVGARRDEALELEAVAAGLVGRPTDDPLGEARVAAEPGRLAVAAAAGPVGGALEAVGGAGLPGAGAAGAALGAALIVDGAALSGGAAGEAAAVPRVAVAGVLAAVVVTRAVHAARPAAALVHAVGLAGDE